jgi:PHD/YefM family antitoxin component YafN of YafNO toxin-antitoxin module
MIERNGSDPMPIRTIKAPIDLATLADAARREPVVVLASGKPAFVAVSPEEFERLQQRAAKGAVADDRLIAAVKAMQRTAASRGLTEAELEKLLADED